MIELKRIPDEEITGEVWEKGHSYVCDNGEVPTFEQYFKWGCDAQLEADQEQVKNCLKITPEEARALVDAFITQSLALYGKVNEKAPLLAKLRKV
jgi:hypothetical protein